MMTSVDDTPTKNGRLLIAAVHNNQYHETERLLALGCDPNGRDEAGWTPIFFAVLNENLGIAKLLISAGARLNIGDHVGWTPLLHAELRQNAVMCDLLRSNGANRRFADFMYRRNPNSGLSKRDQAAKI